MNDPHLPLHKSVNVNDFLLAEADPQLSVTALIPLADDAPSWGDEPEDARARYMEELIAQNYEFHIHDWPGGASSSPEYIVKHTVPTVHRKHTVPKKQSLKARKGIKKTVSSTRKQRRISNYFKPNVGPPPPTNEWLAQKVERLDKIVEELKAETRRLKRKLSRRHPKTGGKFSALVSNLRKHKQRTTSQEPQRTHPQQHDQISETPVESNPSSPIISQYNAQRFSNAPTFNPTITDSPTAIINKVILTVNRTHGVSPPPTPVGASPNHNSPTRYSPNHINLKPQSPARVSPFHVSLDHNSPANSDNHILHDPNTADHASPKVKEPQTSNQTTPENTPPHIPHHSPQTNNTTTPTKQPSPEVSSAPPRLYSTDLTTQLISAFPKRISDVREPETILQTSPLGFTSHATTINAFADTAKKVAQSSTSVAVQGNSNEDQDSKSMPVYLSDSSPTRPLVQHVPTGPEIELARRLLDCKTIPAPKLITEVDPQLWDLFSTTLQTVKSILHINPMTAAFSNESLLRIATPQKWLSSTVRV
ncbi:hypothetical protein Bca52824_019467 [Brassica carinata]|uniref:Uncharacterized protein n=1 Tax=Brassica carinata TaxID=52824 RepID=A0A8X8AYL1_BRACI|nr:hypothetical protein Bca52824_019467 [Brassica carinata]